MFVGVDIGGTKIAAGLVDQNGVIISKRQIATDVHLGFDHVVGTIAGLIEELIKDGESDLIRVEAIGIGIPGITNPETGDVERCINLHWDQVPLKRFLEANFNRPIAIANDATVAGVAEFMIAQEKRFENAVFLTLGTGIGGSVLVNGNIISGVHGIASEIGHMVVGENFYDCNCGRNGCLETFASSTAILRYANKNKYEGVQSSIFKDSLDVTSGAVIFEEAKNGDALALETVDRMVKYLAIGMMNIITIIDPEVIILGGGLSEAGEFLSHRLNLALKNYRYYPSVETPKVEIAKLKNDAGIIGAAIYAKMLL